MSGEEVYRHELVIALETDQPFEENALDVLSRLFRDIEKETVRLLRDAMPRMGHDGEVRLAFEHRSSWFRLEHEQEQDRRDRSGGAGPGSEDDPQKPFCAHRGIGITRRPFRDVTRSRRSGREPGALGGSAGSKGFFGSSREVSMRLTEPGRLGKRRERRRVRVSLA